MMEGSEIKGRFSFEEERKKQAEKKRMEEKKKREERKKEEEKRGAVPKKGVKDFIREKRELTRIGDPSTSASFSGSSPTESILQDPYKLTYESKFQVRKATAYAFVDSKAHRSPWDTDHPENPSRVIDIDNYLVDYKKRMKIIEEPMQFDDEDKLLRLGHTPEYIDTIKYLSQHGHAEDAQQYDSIYFTQDTYASGLDAVKMAVTLGKNVAEGKYQNGFANIRPPGHHATVVEPNGYCIFNNVAITANYLLHEKLAKKILIVDYDVHHGQGIQQLFYKSNKVLYFSIHRYEYGRFWPNLEESNYDYIGEGEGLGYNVNIPLNETGLGDYDYLCVILNVLLPMAYEFQPDIILVASGYDASLGDPEGCMNLTPAFYGHVITLLSGIAGGKIVCFLEGGYFLPTLKESVKTTIRALLNDPDFKLEHKKHINPTLMDTINDVKNILRPIWKCFNQMDQVITVADIYRLDQRTIDEIFSKHNIGLTTVRKYQGIVEKPPFPLVGHYPINKPKQDMIFISQLGLIRDERHNSGQNSVGYMVNEISMYHDPPADSTKHIPETQNRLQGILAKLEEFGLIDEMFRVPFQVNMDDPRPSIWGAVWEEMVGTHSSSYVYELGQKLDTTYTDVYWTERSREVCHMSAAILCQLARRIKRGNIRHGVGLIRPPGHHAKYATPGGFCLINNVAVAANYLVHKENFKKVLIVDFDIHHGDGTQELTYQKDEIMYISMHRFDNQKFFPQHESGNYTYCGDGRGQGYNVNIPFNQDPLIKDKVGSADYLLTWIRIVLPIAYSYDPDMIIISAGFDAAINDPLGNYYVTPETFGHMIQLIKPIAPLIIAVEGGYNNESTGLSMVNVVKALVGHPVPLGPLGDTSSSTINTVANVATIHKPYWPIMEVNRWVDKKMEMKKLSEEESPLIRSVKALSLTKSLDQGSTDSRK